MAIGIVSSDDFDLEVLKDSSVTPEKVTAEIVEIPEKGRGHQREVPDSLRKIIGEESEINGRNSAVALAKQFGISPSSVSAYANGATSTASYDEPKSSIRDHINRSKERISKKARVKLINALDLITPDSLSRVDKLKDVSSIAKDMSSIIKDMEPATENSQTSNAPQFIFYSPQVKREEHFETLLLPPSDT